MKYRHAIAVDLGATNIRAALVSSSGKIIFSLRDKTKKDGKNGRVITDQVISLIYSVIEKADIPRGAIKGIGISSFGPLDYKKGGVKNE